MLTTTTKRGRIGLIIGLLIAGLGIAGTIVLRSSGSSNSNPQGAGVTTVVAKMDIPAGTQLTAAMIEVAQLPANSVPVGAFTDPGAAVGKYAVSTIQAHQVLLPTQITDIAGNAPPPDTTGGGTTTAPVVSGFALKAGDVAIAMPVDPEVAVGYYIQPGDRVDFIVSVPAQAATLKYGFQDVLVLRVGGAGAASGAATPRQDNLIVVELPRRQAEELAVIVGNDGSPMKVIRLVLRPKDSYGKGYLDSGDGTDQPYKTVPNDPPVGPNQLNAIFH